MDSATPASSPTALLRQEIEAARAHMHRLRRQGARVVAPASVQDTFAATYTARIRQEEQGETVTKAPKKGPPLWFALWSLSFVKELRSERLGLFWWFAEPLLLIMVFTIMALLFFGGNVAGMPAFPFAIIGVANFLTFRITLMTTAAGTGHLTSALHDPSVSRFDILLGQAPRPLIANACVAGALLVYLMADGQIPVPERPAVVVICLVFSATMGFSIGMMLSFLTFLYPGIRRLYVIILRLVAISSGLFYVTEQLPQSYKALVLWNPVLHASQLSRDAWFPIYTTQDASFAYVWTCVLGAVILGLAFAIVERRRRAENGEIE